MLLGPSILNADLSNLAELVGSLERGGADYLHLDIMDGHFVPNLTFGPPLVRAIRRHTRLPFDIHLMVEHPEKLIAPFAEAGGNLLTIHAETTPHLHRLVKEIKRIGLKAGVALNPATPPNCLDYLLADLDQVLIMTVNPGWGGQSFIEVMVSKIAEVRRRIEGAGLAIDLQVDGGINTETIVKAREAGANSFVIGSDLFKEENPVPRLSLYHRLVDSFR